jgi:hypothetical protein
MAAKERKECADAAQGPKGQDGGSSTGTEALLLPAECRLGAAVLGWVDTARNRRSARPAARGHDGDVRRHGPPRTTAGRMHHTPGIVTTWQPNQGRREACRENGSLQPWPPPLHRFQAPSDSWPTIQRWFSGRRRWHPRPGPGADDCT